MKNISSGPKSSSSPILPCCARGACLISVISCPCYCLGEFLGFERAKIVDGFSYADGVDGKLRSEEHTSELQSLMRISYAVFCLKKKQHNKPQIHATVHNP